MGSGSGRHPMRYWHLGASVLVAAALTGCDLSYPEIVVVNQTSDRVLIKNPSFNGCLWSTVLAYGSATSPGRCLPGEDRVHFQKLDAQAYCQEQAADGTLAGICACDGGVAPGDGDIDPGLVNALPTWFNYQTVALEHVEYGQFRIFEIRLDRIEQDFSVPGPYGHGH
jgi:hypothetical protein